MNLRLSLCQIAETRLIGALYQIGDKMIITNFVELWKDEDPCKICLVLPSCRFRCESKNKWKERKRNLFIPYMLVAGMILIAVFCFCYSIGCIAYGFGLINKKQLMAFYPFEEMDYFD
jgi:hypothetical protein